MVGMSGFAESTEVGHGRFAARYFRIGAGIKSKVAKWKVKRRKPRKSCSAGRMTR
jgi:hypothetical protein